MRDCPNCPVCPICPITRLRSPAFESLTIRLMVLSPKPRFLIPCFRSLHPPHLSRTSRKILSTRLYARAACHPLLVIAQRRCRCSEPRFLQPCFVRLRGTHDQPNSKTSARLREHSSGLTMAVFSTTGFLLAVPLLQLGSRSHPRSSPPSFSREPSLFQSGNLGLAAACNVTRITLPIGTLCRSCTRTTSVSKSVKWEDMRARQRPQEVRGGSAVRKPRFRGSA